MATRTRASKAAAKANSKAVSKAVSKVSKRSASGTKPASKQRSSGTKAARPAKVAQAAQPEQGKSLYSVHPSLILLQNWIASLREKTGRSLDQWVVLVKKESPKDASARREWLKSEHGLGTNAAWWIADRAEGKNLGEEDPAQYLKAAERYVEELYAAKQHLRAIHDRLIELGRACGPDVRISPCQTMVPLYRTYVFAQIKPTTKTRVDLGMALGGLKASGKLIDTGGFAKKDRITHRIPLASVDEIDAEVLRWLKRAYELDA